MNLLRLAWRNMVYRPLNSGLSILLLALGVGLISLLLLLQKQLNENFDKNLAGVDLVVGAKGSPLQMILSSMYHIDAPTGNVTLEQVRPFLNPAHPLIEEAVPISLGDNYLGFRIVGSTPNLLGWYEAEIGSGRLYEQDLEAVIGADVANISELQIGDVFSSSHGLLTDDELAEEHDHDFKVVGILEPSGTALDKLVLVTNQSYWVMHGDHEGHDHGDHEGHDHDDHEGHDHDAPSPKRLIQAADLLEEDPTQEVTSVLLRFKGHNFQALNMGRNINENTDLQAATPAIEISRIRDQFSRGEQILRLLAIVIIVVSGISVFISLFTSLRDRRYELALMRSMGGGRDTVFGLILFEGLLLGFLGFIVGIVLGHLIMQMIGSSLESSYGYNFSGWQWMKQEWLLLLAALLIGFLAALIPALQASKTDIADTLTN